jgi:ribonuclease HI
MGIGVVLIDGARRRELGEYLGRGTNNLAELTAIGRGLELAAEHTPDLDRRVCVYTDSSYAIGVLSRGWRAKANQELVAALRAHVGRFRDLSFVKVSGHSGIPDNERCDVLATTAATRGHNG